MANQGAPEIPIGDGSLHVGDRVVYPNQGICRITGVETKQIAGQNWEVVTLSREEDGATVMVPRAKVMGIGLRKVANVDAIEEVFDYLAAPTDDPQLDWKVRHRENADKMTGGGLFGTAEVLKGLHALSRVRPLPQKERELYDSARHLIVGEIAAAMGIPITIAENNLDYALFPPPGMKRKGKELLPAAIPATGSAVRTAGDDDLDFDDAAQGDEGEAASSRAAEGPAGAKASAVDDDDEDGNDAEAEEPEEGVGPKPAAGKAATAGKSAANSRPALAAKAPAAPKPPPALRAAPSALAPAAPARPQLPATPARPAQPAAVAARAPHPAAAAESGTARAAPHPAKIASPRPAAAKPPPPKSAPAPAARKVAPKAASRPAAKAAPKKPARAAKKPATRSAKHAPRKSAPPARKPAAKNKGKR